MKHRLTAGMLAAATILAGGCWADADFPDYDLTSTPFSNPYISRDAARLEVTLAEGFVCPDGSQPRISFLDPTGDTALRPVAVLFHGRNFDYVDVTGGHYEEEDRLGADWAGRQVDNILGVGTENLEGEDRGAWAAALLHRGYSVAVPGNCWGDLWHGKGLGDLDGEGFLRMGSYLASETVRLARERPNASTDRLLLIGLAEGGRAITELARAGVEAQGVIVDSSPDFLSPLVTGLSVDQAYTNGLLAIYDSDVREADNEETALEMLRVALDRDSLFHQVTNEDYRTPIFYSYSSLSERLKPETTVPASEAIGDLYTVGSYDIVDWEVAATSPSNRGTEDGAAEPAGAVLDWFDSILPALPSEPTAP